MSTPKSVGFLNRKPKKINIQELYDGGFLLPEDTRNKILEEANNNKKGMHTYKGGSKKPVDFEVFINQKKEAFILGPFLGQGAFGQVYIVQNAKTGAWQMMKRLLKREAGKEVLDKVELDFLKEEGMYRYDEKSRYEDLFIGELIHGTNLSNIIDDNTHQLSFEKSLALSISVLEAFENLQKKGYIHRDIKPDNIMVDLEQEKCFAIDFGMILNINQDNDRPIAGTPGYIPSEIFKSREFNFADDIYAMGISMAMLFSKGMKDVPTNLPKDRQAYFDEFLKEAGSVQHLEKYTKYNISKQVSINHVLFGAKSSEYQTRKNLTPVAIQVFNILYNMTGPEALRPTLEKTLSAMREIRLNHIKSRKSQIPDEYKILLEQLLNKRDNMKIAQKSVQTLLIDNMDAFMLKMVDAKESNRPEIKEVNNYILKLDSVLQTKKMGMDEIKRRVEKWNGRVTGKDIGSDIIQPHESFLEIQNKKLIRGLKFFAEQKSETGQDMHKQYFDFIRRNSSILNKIRSSNEKLFKIPKTQKYYGSTINDVKRTSIEKMSRSEISDRIKELSKQLAISHVSLQRALKSKNIKQDKISQIIQKQYADLQELIVLGETIEKKPITKFLFPNAKYKEIRENCLKDIIETLKQTGLDTVALSEMADIKPRKSVIKKTLKFADLKPNQIDLEKINNTTTLEENIKNDNTRNSKLT